MSKSSGMSGEEYLATVKRAPSKKGKTDRKHHREYRVVFNTMSPDDGVNEMGKHHPLMKVTRYMARHSSDARKSIAV